MEIILLSNTRFGSIRLSVTRRSVPLLAAAVALLVGGAFYGGYRYARLEPETLVHEIRMQTGALWTENVEQQSRRIEALHAESQKSLDAFASRLSVIQGHMLRLDALGSRLASMASLDAREFDFNSSPGIGGPEPDLVQESLNVQDFLRTLSEIDAELEDKADKLAAMETMLIDRELEEQISPDASPAQDGWISSVYGFRTDPMTGKKEFHQGLDFAGRSETQITAAAKGIVTWSGLRPGYGNVVEISHGKGYTTRYAHNFKNLVAVGDRVDKGEIIALMGRSGRTTGTHVHFEVLKYGKHIDPRIML
jgi:murein DD-endopeptidase MepM/ murein hydrolase activator NlpD